MKYLLQKYDNEYVILNDDSDYQAGYVRPLQLGLVGPRYRVQNDECDEIAVVKSINEAIPALAAYYEKNPPRWERESDGPTYGSNADAPGRCGARYIKETQFGPLWVDQIKPGQWLTYRNDHELLTDGKIAIFATCEEAQRAADARRFIQHLKNRH